MWWSCHNRKTLFYIFFYPSCSYYDILYPVLPVERFLSLSMNPKLIGRYIMTGSPTPRVPYSFSCNYTVYFIYRDMVLLFASYGLLENYLNFQYLLSSQEYEGNKGPICQGYSENWVILVNLFVEWLLCY